MVPLPVREPTGECPTVACVKTIRGVSVSAPSIVYVPLPIATTQPGTANASRQSKQPVLRASLLSRKQVSAGPAASVVRC